MTSLEDFQDKISCEKSVSPLSYLFVLLFYLLDNLYWEDMYASMD